MPVIPATQEVEIRRIKFKIRPKQKINNTHLNKYAGHGDG
jgi:hypothetical protein